METSEGRRAGDLYASDGRVRWKCLDSEAGGGRLATEGLSGGSGSATFLSTSCSCCLPFPFEDYIVVTSVTTIMAIQLCLD